MNIHANTEPTGPFPAYISINDRTGGHVTISVRSRGNSGLDIGNMTMTREDALRMAADITKHFAGAGDVSTIPGLRSYSMEGTRVVLNFGTGRDALRAIGAISNAVETSEPVAPAPLPKPPLGSSHFPSLDEMVTRFLGYRFPADFAPDAGVTFVPSKTHRELSWPTGTNILNAVQAKQMITHVVFGGGK